MSARHDLTTVAALAVLAFMAADLSHEVLGHGTIAYLEHAKQIYLFYTALSTDVTGRTLVLAGPLVNLVFGALALIVFRNPRLAPATRLFLFLFGSMSLLNLSAYMILSGATATGDLGVAFSGVDGWGVLRWLMCLIGLATYIGWIPFLARMTRAFAAPLRPVWMVSYFAPLVLNTVAGIFSPLGLHYFLLSALPATAGVNAYLLFLPQGADAKSTSSTGTVVPKNGPVVILAGCLTLLYILLLGPGLKLRG